MKSITSKAKTISLKQIPFSIICDHKFFIFDIGYSIKSKWNGGKANLLLPHKRIEEFDHCCKGVSEEQIKISEVEKALNKGDSL